MNIDTYMPLIAESAAFFAFTMVELAILFVGISFLVGVINEFLPPDKVQRWLSGRNGRGYFIGSILGGLTPFCSCSTIPLTIGLLRAKAGFGPTMAFLFTSPLVNPIIIPLFLTLIGLEVTVVYAVVAIGMSIGISFILEQTGFSRYVKQETLIGISDLRKMSNKKAPPALSSPGRKDGLEPLQVIPLQPAMQCCANPLPVSARGMPAAVSQQNVASNRWNRIFQDAVGQFRKLLPFIILGVAIGSIIHGFLPADLVVRLAGSDNPMAIPVSAAVGIPLYLRVSTMVPIAASLIAKGMSIGAVVALIIGGAGASLPEVAMLRGIFKTPLLVAFIGSVMVMAISAGFLVSVIII